MVSYTSQRPLRDIGLCTRIKQLAQAHPRYGYRRIWALLRRQGERMNHKRVYRLWREHGLSLRPRRPRKRTGPPLSRRPEATRPHEMWAYDFVYDRCANGEALKCLAVVDEYTRLCLALVVGSRIDSSQVIAVLQHLIHAYGVPRYLRSDNGPEFVAYTVKAWLSTNGIGATFIEPGKPWQNGAVESFIGKFRDECLNMEWFHNRLEARIIIEQYRRDYNAQRPHSSLNYRTPAEVHAGMIGPPTTEDQEAVHDQLRSAGLTLPLV
jgi:putative transposase